MNSFPTRLEMLVPLNSGPTPRNGVDVSALLETVESVHVRPEYAHFQFRARSRWINGTHSQSVMSDYYGGGAEQTRGKTFTADSDATTLLRGSDSGPTPMEYLLHALASCLTIGVATIAAQRGIRLNAVEATAEGDVDIRGVLGVPADDRPGFHGIRITFDIKGEADREELGDILRQAKARSPVFEILTSGAPVELGMGSR